jgi:hypothetical protein
VLRLENLRWAYLGNHVQVQDLQGTPHHNLNLTHHHA